MAVAIVAEIVAIILIRRKKTDKEFVYSFAGLFLAVIIPNHAYLIISLLGAVVLLLGAYIVYLVFAKKRTDEKSDEKFDEKFDEKSNAKINEKNIQLPIEADEKRVAKKTNTQKKP